MYVNVHVFVTANLYKANNYFYTLEKIENTFNLSHNFPVQDIEQCLSHQIKEDAHGIFKKIQKPFSYILSEFS